MTTQPSIKRPIPPRMSAIGINRRLDIVKAVLESRPSFNIYQTIEMSKKIEKYVKGIQ